MTTRKLKVWCEACRGERGKDESWHDHHPAEGPIAPGTPMWIPCRECEDENGISRGFTLVEVLDLPDGRVVVVGGGPVYEAEAVGKFNTTDGEPQIEVEGDADERLVGYGDLIAVGLKEVGK